MSYNPKGGGDNKKPTRLRLPGITQEDEDMLYAVDDDDWGNHFLTEYRKELEQKALAELEKEQSEQYSYLKSIPAELASGAISAYKDDIRDIPNLLVSAIHSALGNEEKGLSNMGELESEKTRKMMMDAFNIAPPTTATQRTASSMANTAGNFIGGIPLLAAKVPKLAIEGTKAAYNLGHSALNAIKEPELLKRLGDWFRGGKWAMKEIKPTISNAASSVYSGVKDTASDIAKQTAKDFHKNAAMGAAVGGVSQYMEEEDVPPAYRFPVLAAMGFVPGAVERMPTATRVSKGKNDMYKALQEAIGESTKEISKTTDYGSNYFAKEGAPALWNEVKETRASLSKEYNHALSNAKNDVFDKLIANTDIRNKDMKVLYGNETKAMRLEDALRAENFNPKNLKEVTSQVTKRMKKADGPLQHTLAQDRRVLNDVLSRAVADNKQLSAVDQQYRLAKGVTDQQNLLAYALSGNKQTTLDTVKGFGKALSDPEKLIRYKTLNPNNELSNMFLKHQTSTQKGAEDFLTKRWLGTTSPEQAIPNQAKDFFGEHKKEFLDRLAKGLEEVKEIEKRLPATGGMSAEAASRLTKFLWEYFAPAASPLEKVLTGGKTTFFNKPSNVQKVVNKTIQKQPNNILGKVLAGIEDGSGSALRQYTYNKESALPYRDSKRRDDDEE